MSGKKFHSGILAKKRTAKVYRKTTETRIDGMLVIDGVGKTDVKTGIGFLDHMLTLMAFHGLFDLRLKVKGDLEVDIHHTNEDIAIALGQAFRKALGACKGIRRFGASEVPMDHARAKVAIDIANRFSYEGIRFPYASEPPALSSIRGNTPGENYSMEDGNDFLETLAKNIGMNMHVDILAMSDMHHMLEAIFKALGIALDRATEIDPRRRQVVPSTKGIL
ncbi:MAG: imidazoleglycerol-phosphate dehydratase [Candidatus Omnitrophica bacterium]|nr:imidazoleglycerol-phosphate dehydratase [Candidatus Omnitrophota bacterium]